MPKLRPALPFATKLHHAFLPECLLVLLSIKIKAKSLRHTYSTLVSIFDRYSRLHTDILLERHWPFIVNWTSSNSTKGSPAYLRLFLKAQQKVLYFQACDTQPTLWDAASSMARRTARITKRLSSTSKMTRRRSRLTPGSSSNGAALQNMVEELAGTTTSVGDHVINDAVDGDEGLHAADEDMLEAPLETQEMDTESQEYFDALSQPQDKGKGRFMEETEEEKPFPLMELPTEIRLEIYRACLTRPYKILLSRVEQPKCPEPTTTDDGQAEGDTDDLVVDDERQLELARQHTLRTLNWRPSSPTNPVSFGSQRLPNGTRPVARINRSIRLASSPSTSQSSTNAGSSTVGASAPITYYPAPHPRSRSRRTQRPVVQTKPTYDTPTKGEDPLVINILRTSKEVYKEARGVLYSENVFDIDINTAVNSLAALHQRSRRNIKHIELEIPTYTEILERFSEIVRLSLRYCTGLKKFVIHTPFTLPGADGSMSSSNTTVYANGFDILRWLPQQCEVVLEGSRNAEIEAVVTKHLNLAKTQDKVRFALLRHPCQHGKTACVNTMCTTIGTMRVERFQQDCTPSLTMPPFRFRQLYMKHSLTRLRSSRMRAGS